MADNETPTKSITIQGVVFDVSAPYAEGHTVTEAEAKALNQVRAENIRNNMAKQVKAAKEQHGEELPSNVLNDLASQIAEYDRDYEFTLASVGGGRQTRDPVEAEARKIAKASIAASLKAQGRTMKSITHDAEGNEIEGGKDRLEAAIAKVAADDKVRKAAADAVKKRNQVSESAVADLDL